MDVLEDQPRYEEALIAMKLRNRRWDAVTGGLIAVAILLTCHAVKAGLWRRDIALANSKVNKELTALVYDVDQLQHQINKKKEEGEALADNIKRLGVELQQVPGKHLDLGSSFDLLSEDLRRAQMEVDTARGNHIELYKEKTSARDGSRQIRRALDALLGEPPKFIKDRHFVYSVGPFQYKEDMALGLHLGATSILSNKKVKVLGIEKSYMIHSQNKVQSIKIEKMDRILMANGIKVSSGKKDMEDFLQNKHSGNLVLVVESAGR